MGVLNVTPDSFSDGGKFFETERAVEHGLRMEEEGADIIDVGGESSRPGSLPIPLLEEERRVLPVIEKLARCLKVPLSIDTYKSQLAEKALSAGASIVNDISGLRFDKKMASVVSETKAGVVIMHIKGTPKDMQNEPFYSDVVNEVIEYLREGIEIAKTAGVEEERILIDPGIGFGKTVEHNLILLSRLSEMKVLGMPILIGTSRKSFIGKILELSVEDRLEGTSASVSVAIMNGANIVRVHDVKEMKRVVKVVDAIRFCKPSLNMSEFHFSN